MKDADRMSLLSPLTLLVLDKSQSDQSSYRQEGKPITADRHPMVIAICRDLSGQMVLDMMQIKTVRLGS